MINNLYNNHKLKKGLQRTHTEKDDNLISYTIKKISKQPAGRIPQILNVSVNGKEIVSHISPNFKSLQITTNQGEDYPFQTSTKNAANKNINLKQYIYRKYVSEASEYQINKEYDLNPQMERLVRLRKVFNEKYRNKSCCEQKSVFLSRREKDKKLGKKDISQIIRITNPDIYASTFVRKSQKEDFAERQIKKKKKPQIKYMIKQKIRQQNSFKALNQASILIQPWEAD